MKILLATDGSPCSELAVDEIARRPFPDGSELRVISVIVPPDPPTIDPLQAAAYYTEEFVKRQREHAQEAVDQALSKLREGEESRKLHVTSEVLNGSAKGEIIEEAERFNADLIVVGSHGYGVVKRFWLGSVSQALALHAPCSVEIVRCRSAAQASEGK